MKLGLREIIFFKLMIGLLVASYFMGLKRMNEKRQGYEEQITLKQNKLTDLARAKREIDDIEHKLDTLTQAIDYFKKKLPSEQGVDEILDSTNQLITAHNLNCVSFKPSPKPIVGPGYREKQIEILLTGDFFGFYQFLADIERRDRIIKVTDLKLTKIDEEAGRMQAVMRLSIFFDPAGASEFATAQ